MNSLIHLARLLSFAIPVGALAGSLPTMDQVFTATTHPMRYAISLPKDWTPDRSWPVIVAPNAHYGSRKATLQMFAPLSEARKKGFIIVSPIVINADPVAKMTEYRGAIADQISAADAKLGESGRDVDNRAVFDSAGIRAVIKDVQLLYHGENRVYITGFSASTHIVYLFVFNHPELLKGAVINSGVYRGRGVDEDHLPLPNSPERARVGIKFIVGETDQGCQSCLENWAETKALLQRCGHPKSQIHEEIIQKGNPDNLGTDHRWFPTRIMDFFIALEHGGGGS